MLGRMLAVDRNRTSFVLAALAVFFWVLGFSLDSPWLDALGSLLIIGALVTKLMRTHPER
jgi:hypothetical protein